MLVVYVRRNFVRLRLLYSPGTILGQSASEVQEEQELVSFAVTITTIP